jgi:AcrR family transcriptional regulator
MTTLAMARVIPSTRFTRLIELATQTFIQRGYRQTQIAEVAQTLGVERGTIYGYVESKEALFDAALRYADQPHEAPAPDALPIRTPKSRATIPYVRDRLRAELKETALARIACGVLTVEDPVQELKAIP